ncbi:hypothetical protein [Clostridium transplantifaecale]|uniref:hypothetical protein n=1 Tax=Clostridium transplantifaecale TaxID=2479838 RepID=UPI000F63A6FD|nr:hypothetical protein [Clostridium transplantifaecale]
MSNLISIEGKTINKTRLITAKQVQEEYLNIDIRNVRAFLNAYCRYRKIGNQYFYIRSEVEEKLLESNDDIEYRIDNHISKRKIVRARRKR